MRTKDMILICIISVIVSVLVIKIIGVPIINPIINPINQTLTEQVEELENNYKNCSEQVEVWKRNVYDDTSYMFCKENLKNCENDGWFMKVVIWIFFVILFLMGLLIYFLYQEIKQIKKKRKEK